MAGLVLWQRLACVLGGVIAFGWLARRYRRLPAIWRGEATVRAPVGRITVYRRSYLTYLWILTGLLGGVGAILTALGFGLSVLGVAGLVLLASTIPSSIIHMVVNAFNRPRLLIAPPYRHLPGTVAERAIAKERRRAGLAPTDHLVEIHDVRPYDPTEYEPFLVAACAEEGCDWFEFPKLTYDSAQPDEYAAAEEELRRIASRHTTRVAPGLQRPLS